MNIVKQGGHFEVEGKEDGSSDKAYYLHITYNSPFILVEAC
jgi:hypothetical protein